MVATLATLVLVASHRQGFFIKMPTRWVSSSRIALVDVGQCVTTEQLAFLLQSSPFLQAQHGLQTSAMGVIATDECTLGSCNVDVCVTTARVLFSLFFSHVLAIKNSSKTTGKKRCQVSSRYEYRKSASACNGGLLHLESAEMR